MNPRLPVLLSVAGGLCLGSALVVPNWPSVGSGVLVLGSALTLALRRGAYAAAAGPLFGGAVLGAVLGAAGLVVWQMYDHWAPRRNLERDADYATRGTLVLAAIERTDSVQVFSNRGDHVESCAYVRFQTADGRPAAGNRCDFSPQELSQLEAVGKAPLPMLYLPEELEPRDLSLGIEAYARDFRLVRELGPKAQAALEERHLPAPKGDPLWP